MTKYIMKKYIIRSIFWKVYFDRSILWQVYFESSILWQYILTRVYYDKYILTRVYNEKYILIRVYYDKYIMIEYISYWSRFCKKKNLNFHVFSNFLIKIVNITKTTIFICAVEITTKSKTTINSPDLNYCLLKLSETNTN